MEYANSSDVSIRYYSRTFECKDEALHSPNTRSNLSDPISSMLLNYNYVCARYDRTHYDCPHGLDLRYL